jgi:protein TonB
MSSPPFDWRGGGLRLFAVIGFHLMGLALLMRYGTAQSAINLAPPIMVSIIAPPAEQPIELPKPLPIKRVIKEPPKKIITAEAAKPTEFAAPPPEVKILPQPVAPPAPVIAEAVIIPPKFNADYLDNPAPGYPSRSKRDGEQGKVLLRVLVNSNGFPDKVEVSKSSGFARLDNAALQAVEHWKFVPARQGTQAIVASVIVPVSFILEK